MHVVTHQLSSLTSPKCLPNYCCFVFCLLDSMPRHWSILERARARYSQMNFLASSTLSYSHLQRPSKIWRIWGRKRKKRSAGHAWRPWWGPVHRKVFSSSFHVPGARVWENQFQCSCPVTFSCPSPWHISLASFSSQMLTIFPAGCPISSQDHTVWLLNYPPLDSDTKSSPDCSALVLWYFAVWFCPCPVPDYPPFRLQTLRKSSGARFPSVLPAGQLPLRFDHHLLRSCGLTAYGDAVNMLAPVAAHTGSVSLQPALMPWLLGPHLALMQWESFCALLILLLGDRAVPPRGSCEPASPSNFSLPEAWE